MHKNKMFLFAVLLFLINTVEYSSSERFIIVPSPDSPCPGEFTGEPCLTLQQYVANPSLSSDVTLEVHPGNHSLESRLSVSNINSFTMRANTSATVTCHQRFYFGINRLQQIYVSGITFVGCMINLNRITNATFERSSFVNGTRYCCPNGAALHVEYSSLLIRLCTFYNNKGYFGGAIYLRNGNMDLFDNNFYSNLVLYDGRGGAVYFDGGSITVTNNTFINNTASGGGGGAIYSARRYTNVSLINNSFSQNKAAYCGVIDVDEFYHDNVNITGNTFIYNRAVELSSGNNGGGVICIRNASMTISDNNFSHNSAVGDAGVIRVDESNVMIDKSIFNNNTAGGNGGVFHTYFYPTRYSITASSFTDNQAGGDGGVMYVGRAGSRVTISQSIFGFNNATNRGGVIAIIGSTLEINSSSIFENTAALGEVISACNSEVTITNPEFLASQDPIYSFCTLYDGSNSTVSRTMEESTPTTDTNTDPLTVASTTTEGDALTTMTLPLTDDVTSTEEVTTITETARQTEEVTTTTEDTVKATTIVSTTEDIDIETTTIPEPMQDTTTTVSVTVTDSETTTTALTENVNTTISPSQEISTTDEDIIVTSTHEEGSTTEESIRTITPPQTISPETSTKPESSTDTPTTTGPIVNPVSDEDQDTANYNFHYILPGYVSIGVSAVVLVLICVLVIVIAVKVFRVKTKLQNVNLSTYEYPAVKNEYSLPDVHVAHT